MPRSSSSSSFKRTVAALALGAVTLLAGWFFFARRHDPPEVSPPPEDTTTAAAPERETTDAAPPSRKPQPSPAPKADDHVAADGLGFMPQHAGDPKPPGPLHPHPITPTHERIFAENRIAFALDDATDAKDVVAMRKLLDQYRRDFPEDQWQLQGGYAMVLECLEHPGPASRAAAERWLDQNNGSTVKRSVLRNCIEPPQP